MDLAEIRRAKDLLPGDSSQQALPEQNVINEGKVYNPDLTFSMVEPILEKHPASLPANLKKRRVGAPPPEEEKYKGAPTNTVFSFKDVDAADRMSL